MKKSVKPTLSANAMALSVKSPLVIEIKSGIPLESTVGRKIFSPVTLAMQKMKVGDCFDLPPAFSLNGVYQSARSARIKVQTRHVTDDKGQPVLRVWKTSAGVVHKNIKRAKKALGLK